MKAEVQLINLKDLDINSLELPKDPFVAYILANETVPSKELLTKMVLADVKDINVCGKWAGTWEGVADNICVEYENNGEKLDWCCTTESSELDNFISMLAFAHCQYFDDEVLSHDPILLFYDDENLKNFVLKRVDWYLEDSQKEDEHENDEDDEYYYKERSLRQRVELNCKTTMSAKEAVCSPTDMVWYANRANLAGLAICDTYSVQGYAQAQKEASRGKKRLRVLYGANIGTTRFVSNTNVIAKNQKGKKAIYEYLTHKFTKEDKLVFYKRDNDVDWITTESDEIIDNNSENLLFGLAYNSSAIANILLIDDAPDVIDLVRHDINNSDYVEVAPICAYKEYYPNKSEDEIKAAIKLMINVAKEENKLVVATSAPLYSHDNKYLEYSILYEYLYNLKLPDDFDRHIYSTEEMRYAFDWLNDDALVEEIVVTNTHKVMECCEDFKPFDNVMNLPEDEFGGDHVALVTRCTLKMNSLYGPNVDEIIKNRLHRELEIIENNGYASIFMLTAGICDAARAKGYKYGYRGSIGATLVGYLLGISECNPLPPHTVCPKCHKVIWNANVESGFDIEPHKCKECDVELIRDGQNIPYQSLFGLEGERLPDIDLNLDPEFVENIEEELKEVIPNCYVVRAGTIISIGYRKAGEMVTKFAGEDDGAIDNELRHDLTEKLSGVKESQGIHRSGFIIVPNEIDINDYTPLIKVDDKVVTHMEYYDISDNFYKCDCLCHADPAALRYMEQMGLDLSQLDINDPKIMELFDEKDAILGVPEFGIGYTSFITDLVKPNKFSDLVKICNFAHGTNVWNNNGKELYEKGIRFEDLLSSREDIYNSLHRLYEIDEENAYKIMERVRKGKGLEEEHEKLMLDHNVPKWYIDSCNTIKYMFPKAHAVTYVINALKFAWAKIYKPAYFYAQYFEYRTDEVDIDTLIKDPEEIKKHMINYRIDNIDNRYKLETYKVAIEMKKRGINLVDKRTGDEPGHFVVNPEDDKEIIYKN